MHQGIGDRPLLLLGVLLVFIGVQLVTFGLLAELQARTYHESQDKPTYVIREIRRGRRRAPPSSSTWPASGTASAAITSAKPPREHDPRITVIQRELFDETQVEDATGTRDLVVGQPGPLGAASSSS